MNRTRKVVYNTITAFLHIIVNQLISLTVSIKVLEIYGPDYHGLNSILSNVMIWFLVLEGGLTTASTVAMYKPFMSKDYDRCNEILSASRIRFNQVGSIILFAGLVCAWIYPLFLKTPIAYWETVVILTIMSFSTAFGIIYTRKFGLMYSVTQNEYILQFISIILGIVANLVVLVIALNRVHYIFIRLIFFASTIFTGFILSVIIKKKYSFINYHSTPDLNAITGTKDVVMQKLTGILRSSVPSLYIASFLGTTWASIYSVNLYGYNFTRNILVNIYTATQSGIGQIVAERDNNAVYKVFRVFEYIGISMLMLMMSTAFVMTIPFVRFYTRNLSGEIPYVNYWLWIIIAINVSIQMLHIPSGIIINMNAKFKEDRNFQIAGIVVMIAGMMILGYFFKLEGIMLGVTLGSLTLGACEVYYTRSRIFHLGYADYFKPILVDLVVLIPAILIECKFFPEKVSIIEFFVFALISGICHLLLLVVVNLIFERERFFMFIERIKKILDKKMVS